MDYNIYQIKYETRSNFFPCAAVSAESQDRAISLLEKHIVEAIPGLECAEDISFKTTDIINSGIKSDKEGVILPLKDRYC